MALAHVHDVHFQLLVTSLLAHLKLRVGNVHGVVGWIDDDGYGSVRALHLLVMSGVVVSVEYHVEARHLACDVVCGVV